METFASFRIQILLRCVLVFAMKTMKKLGSGGLAILAQSMAHKKRLPQTQKLTQGAPTGLQDACIALPDAPGTRRSRLPDASKTSNKQKISPRVPHQASRVTLWRLKMPPGRVQVASSTSPRQLQSVPVACRSLFFAARLLWKPPDSILETTWTSWSCILDPCGIVLGRFLAPNSVSLFQSAPPSSRHSHTT